MKLKDIDIKGKVKMVAETISVDNDGVFHYFEDMLGTFNESDSSIIKEKMDNLVTLLGEVNAKSEMDSFGELDFETEIWEMI